MPLFFSLMGCLVYTGSLQAQLVLELENSLQGAVKSIQIEPSRAGSRSSARPILNQCE